MEVELDNKLIFNGEMKKQFGNSYIKIIGMSLSREPNFESIIFTRNQSIISKTLELNNKITFKEYEVIADNILKDPPIGRPKTARKSEDRNKTESNAINTFKHVTVENSVQFDKFSSGNTKRLQSTVKVKRAETIVGQFIIIILGENWEQNEMLGLTSIYVFGRNSEIIKIQPDQISGEGNTSNLINERDITCNPNYMWIIE